MPDDNCKSCCASSASAAVGKIGHGFPKIFGFVSFIDGDSERLNPKIILEPVGHVFRRCKGEGRDGEDYTRRGHAGAIAFPAADQVY